MTNPPQFVARTVYSPEPCRLLRSELDGLADALVDAGPADRVALCGRVRHAVDMQRECGMPQGSLARLLEHILSDLTGDGATLDTLYYARQLAALADRLPN